jgi:dolichyl-phosphate beta-glucosyltransferase
MPADELRLSIIIPTYNGAEQLPASFGEIGRYLAPRIGDVEVILIDDHSDEPAARLLEEFAGTTAGVRLIRNDRNQGKGYSVARGMMAARGRYRVFTDADLAYPIEEVDAIVGELEAGVDVAVACRVLPESRYVMSPTFFHYLYTRHLMSRLFNRLVRWLLLPDILDTQAGLKGFTARAAETIFPRLTIPGFGFDVECLYIAQKHGMEIQQTPVRFRYDSEPSSVHLANDALRMIRDLVRIRRNDHRGLYG